jgi:hypothetical protein
MKAEVFAEWFRRQGHKVLQTESSYWVNFGPGVYQAFPYHYLINPSDKEIADLFKRAKAIGLRYSAPLENNQGCTSYHAILITADLDGNDFKKIIHPKASSG